MRPHEQRVVAEYDELCTRVVALGEFTSRHSFTEVVSRDEQHRMLNQLYHMRQLRDILADRIAHFPPMPTDPS